ncbi:MAG TPA: SMI1/KNR4 family protein, partial [Kofleriaceae bacterium]|nr:SMI1/KNR4 family protein [Kofleriaceae bacterium]
MTGDVLRELRDRIRLLAAIDRGRQVFGAGTHAYRLAPPLSDAELAALEARFGELPAEYRRFVREIGAHGAGPYHGLVPPAVPDVWGGELDPDPARPFARGAETA